MKLVAHASFGALTIPIEAMFTNIRFNSHSLLVGDKRSESVFRMYETHENVTGGFSLDNRIKEIERGHGSRRHRSAGHVFLGEEMEGTTM